MEKETRICCPYCSCKDVSRTKDQGLIEIGPMDLSEDEAGAPMDIWVCSECLRRFVLIDKIDEES